MPEETKNAAVSGEWKLVPMAQLKKWHRDLDACQKVMWLRGGFDPAYCMDAQDCLKEMEGVLACPVPPAGGMPERMDVPPREEYEMECYWAADLEQAKAHNSCLDACEPIFTRLQAENAALQQRLNVADQRVDELESALKFYADKDHFHFDDPEKWDSVSGEAENLLWHEEDPAYIEDGSIARNALKVKP